MAPPRQPRLNLSLGFEFDGSIKADVGFKRVLNAVDQIQIGAKRNSFHNMRYWFTYNNPISFYLPRSLQKFSSNPPGLPESWQTSLSYEVDNKSNKFLSREHSLVFRAQNEGSPLSFEAESTFRKNMVD